MPDTKTWGSGSSSPRKKPGTTPRLFSYPTAATSPRGLPQIPPPTDRHDHRTRHQHPHQLCSAERIDKPINALLSRHTSCIPRPAPGEDARHVLPIGHRCVQPGHPSAPETDPLTATTPPIRHPVDPVVEHIDPLRQHHPERVRDSPGTGEPGRQKSSTVTAVAGAGE